MCVCVCIVESLIRTLASEVSVGQFQRSLAYSTRRNHTVGSTTHLVHGC